MPKNIQWFPIGEHKVDIPKTAGNSNSTFAYPHPTMRGWKEVSAFTGVATGPLKYRYRGVLSQREDELCAFRLIEREMFFPTIMGTPTRQRDLFVHVQITDWQWNKTKSEWYEVPQWDWRYVPHDHYASEEDFKNFAEQYWERMLNQRTAELVN